MICLQMVFSMQILSLVSDNVFVETANIIFMSFGKIICNNNLLLFSFWALIWYWDHLKNFIAEIPQGPLGMSIGTIWVTQKRFQGPPARGF